MSDRIASGRRTLTLEADAIARIARQLDDSFVRAVDVLRKVDGRVIVSGVGKSGLIARKIAATFTSMRGTRYVPSSLTCVRNAAWT